MDMPELNKVFVGDCREVMAAWPDNFVDTIITDPPYGLEFMGKDWDSPWKYGFSKPGYVDANRKERPSFSSSRNPICLSCRKRKRTWADGPGKCSCAKPSWDESRAEDMQQYQDWATLWAEDLLRVAKPGSMFFCFGGTRTFHRMTCAIEDAGWEIRDCLMWLYGSGFPKSLSISTAIDKAIKGHPQGSTRGDPDSPNSGKFKTQATEGKRSESDKGQHFGAGPGQFMLEPGRRYKRDLVEAAKIWEGWGTALKPAWEPIILAMKPLDGTFADNAIKHGTAGLNIDGSRVEYISDADKASATPQGVCTGKLGALAGGVESDTERTEFDRPELKGRWPANLILDEEAAAMLDAQSGGLKSGDGCVRRQEGKFLEHGGLGHPGDVQITHGDMGGASRFFYVAKANKSEKNLGLDGMPEKQRDDGRKEGNPGGDNPRNRGVNAVQNFHPTVKPVSLIKYLCELTKTPTGGIVLDPFLGSGTTAVACEELGRKWLGIEQDPAYVAISRKRIRYEAQELKLNL